MSKLKIILTAILAAGALTGCATNARDNDNNNNGVENTGYENIGTRDDGLIDNRENNNGMTNTNNNNNGMTNNNNGDNNRRMNVAEKASDRIAAMKEVDRAYTVTTDNNAYVAVVLAGNPNRNLSDKLKNKIADKVKKTDNDIDNVYVSENPDFADSMRDYVDRIQRGEPIAGFFNEFGNMTRRVFPNAR